MHFGDHHIIDGCQSARSTFWVSAAVGLRQLLGEVTQVDVGRRHIFAEDAGEGLAIAACLGDGALVDTLQRIGQCVELVDQMLAPGSDPPRSG